MKTIGIKLADGSFYPVLEEGKPSEKQLDLTTAHNNQTKIMVDLYRSSNCTMDDAEYVDSLQIENLNEHPNGEPAISFQVSIDENNELSAKIMDPETGKQSNTTITLVSRTVEERLVTDEYNISDTIISDGLNANKKDGKTSKKAGKGLLALADEINKKDEQDSEETISEDDFTLGDPDAGNNDEEEADETVTDDINDMNFDLPDITEEAPAETEETAVTDAEVTGDFSGLPDFDDIPDFDIDQGNLEEDEFKLDSQDSDFVEDDAKVVDDSLNLSNDDFNFDENSLPDLDFNSDTSDTKDDNVAPEDDYSLPDFDDIPDTVDDNNNILADLSLDDKPSEEPVASGNGISFTGLYDTDELNASSDTTGDDVKKKTRVPVIICIVCAIICVIATLLVLFIIPSKYNLLTKKNNKEQVAVEEVIETPIAEPEPVVEPEPEPEPEPIPEPEPEPVPEAVEDEVIVIEKAEEVVPLPPPVVEEVKPKNITYKIHWGDTLWDIANTYYKNPWKYKYIARYNGIKDPDYIISGTYIIIPAE